MLAGTQTLGSTHRRLVLGRKCEDKFLGGVVVVKGPSCELVKVGKAELKDILG